MPHRSSMIWTASLVVTLLTLGLVGCGAAAWVAHGAGGGKTRTYNLKAQYLGLENQRVAVLVAADEYLLFQHPGAPLKVSRAVSARIATNVEGVTILSPQRIDAFTRQNPYWTTSPPSRLVRELGVDRLVIIDLSEYRTREPGNAHVWHGMITGEVGVIEADADDPDAFAFSTVVRAEYPEETVIGLLNSDDETVELGMLAIFARDAGGLFFDHQIER